MEVKTLPLRVHLRLLQVLYTCEHLCSTASCCWLSVALIAGDLSLVMIKETQLNLVKWFKI